jgi:uncharacterized SAM-binding protein YcdF (DUF218 family)
MTAHPISSLSWRRIVVPGVAAACLVVGAWAAGLVHFADRIPRDIGDSATQTDAIVVLTGGSKRLAAGLRLLAERKADRVLVSGVHHAVDLDHLLTVAPGDADLACCVEAGRGALDTSGNAEEAAAWMRRNGFRSLRLVTSSYHMPRSLLEFRWSLPSAQVIPHPVFADNLPFEDWWHRPRTVAVVVSEYNKFLLAWLRHIASGLTSAAAEDR